MLALLAAAAGARAQTSREGVRVDYPTGSDPSAVVIADVDHSGIPDVLVANAGSRTVSVLIADAPGHFEPKRDLPVGEGPRGMVVADVNGDGNLDIITANSAENTVTVLRGAVRAGFYLAPRQYPTGTAPRAIAVADVNGDGAPDLATANYFGGGVSILINDGHGTFDVRQDYVTGTAPAGVAFADLDGDGRLDLVVTNSASNNVVTMPGDGHGHFGPRTAYVVGTSPTGVAVDDVDGDGLRDVVVANTNDSTAIVLRGDGRGRLTRAFVFATGRGPSAVAIEDLDGDGRADILVANARANTVSWFASTGAGAFRPRVDFGTGPMPNAIAVAEINGDGRPDIVTTNSTVSSVCVNLGDFANGLAVRSELALSGAPVAVATGDLDGDHVLDAVVADFDSNAVVILRGDGRGRFAIARSMPVGRGPLGVALTDLDGDGFPDLVASSSIDAKVGVWFGRGDGTFTQPPTYYPVGLGPGQVMVRDVMGDATPDLVVVCEQSATVAVLLGTGNGTFGVATEWPAGSSPRSLAIADMNSDGRPDLVTSEFNARTIALMLSTGSVGFAPPVEVAIAGLNPSAVALADLNGDHFADAVVASYGSSLIEVLFGDGTGGFSTGQLAAVGSGPRALSIADVNDDGALDLLVANSLSGSISVLLGNGAGVFATHADFATGARPLAVLGFDPDGAGGPLHLLAVQYEARTLVTLPPRTRTTASLERAPMVSIADAPVTLTARVTRLDRAAPVPTGDVRFYVGSHAIGVATLSDTVATLVTRALPLGLFRVHAEYAGDAWTTGSSTAPQWARAYRCAIAPAATVSPTVEFEGATLRIAADGVPDVTSVRFGGVAASAFEVKPTWFATDSAAVEVIVNVPAGAISGPVQLETPCGELSTSNVFEMRRHFVLGTAGAGGYGYLSAIGWPVLRSLGDTLGMPISALALRGGEDHDWRVRAWDPAAQAYEHVASLHTGRGYWIQTRGPWSAEIIGTVARDETLVLPLLHRGWHLFGNPFPQSIPVASLQVLKRGIAHAFLGQTDVMRSVFVWDGAARRYVATDAIPGESMFWVRRLAIATPESLLVPPPGAAPPAPAPANDAPIDWRARVLLAAGESHAEVTLGVAPLERGVPHALTAWSPPPAPDDAPTLSLLESGAEGTERYASLVLDRAATPSWTLALSGARAPGEVTLELDADALPEGHVLVLADETSGERSVLVPGVPVARAVLASGRTWTLRLVEQSEAHARPLRDEVRAYPTPFANATGFRFRHGASADLRVTVYDVAGRAVRTLERRGAEPGEHVLVWDGRDARGAELPAAVYFARCRTGGSERVLRVVRVR